MSYQIITKIRLQSGDEARVQALLTAEPRIRHMMFDEEEDTQYFDMRGDFETQKEDTLWLCERLVNAGFLNFNIRHSF